MFAISGCTNQNECKNVNKIAYTKYINGENTYAYAKITDSNVGNLYIKDSAYNKETFIEVNDVKSVEAGPLAMGFIKIDGTVIIKDWYNNANNNYDDWNDICQIAFVGLDVYGLKTDGSIVAKSRDMNQNLSTIANEALQWTDIKFIASDTSVSLYGINEKGDILLSTNYLTEVQSQTVNWKNIEYIYSSNKLAIATTCEEEVLYYGYMGNKLSDEILEGINQCEGAHKIVMGKYCIAALFEDGTLKIIPFNYYDEKIMQYDCTEGVSDIYGNNKMIAILRNDGEIILLGTNYE